MKILIIYILFAIGPVLSIPTPFIVGGVNATIEEIPYIVAIRYFNQSSNSYRHVCGGSIINHDTIVSAAHCLDGRIPFRTSNLFVRAGSDFTSLGGHLIRIRRIINHPGYIARDLLHDINVLKLSQRLQFGRGIWPIKLPPRGMRFRPGVEFTVSGWGRLGYGMPAPDRLQTVQVAYIPNHICANIYRYIRPTFICAGWLGVGKRDACSGDSGGPLVHKNFLVGIVAGGYGCAEPYYPGFYTRTSEYLEFISRSMRL